jgi:hypothetical protein
MCTHKNNFFLLWQHFLRRGTMITWALAPVMAVMIYDTRSVTFFFFLKRRLKWRQKLYLNLLIKKKRIAQLIMENSAKTVTITTQTTPKA